MFSRAITRIPSKNFAEGVTTVDFGAPSYDLVLKQHAAYCDTLKKLGLEVEILPAAEDFPDGMFVEDTAIVTPEMAVMTIPGHPNRRGEQSSIEPALSKYRTIEHITGEGRVDGGDILMVGKHFFIGQSDRTNVDGARQLASIVEKYGYTWDIIPVAAGLHFKCSVTQAAEKTLVVTEEMAHRSEFKDYELIVVDKAEEYAANVLLINDNLLMPEGFEKTYEQVSRLDVNVIKMDTTEFRKMDGALTCLSLRF